MGECNDQNCCCTCHENQDSCQDGDQHDEKTKWLIEAADCAWMEVLKDKIKEQILATQNEQMTQLAKIVSEANGQRWKLKMAKKQAIEDFKEKICNFFQSKK